MTADEIRKALTGKYVRHIEIRERRSESGKKFYWRKFQITDIKVWGVGKFTDGVVKAMPDYGGGVVSLYPDQWEKAIRKGFFIWEIEQDEYNPHIRELTVISDKEFTGITPNEYKGEWRK